MLKGYLILRIHRVFNVKHFNVKNPRGFNIKNPWGF